MQANVEDAEVITIFLIADEVIRQVRMTNRIQRINKEQYREESRKDFDRLRKDREIFKTCKCNYVVDANRELEEVLKDVIEIVEEESN